LQGRWPWRRAKEDLFLLIREAKTFAPTPSSSDVLVLHLARNQTSKSFLVLFFKKEHFTLLYTSRRAAAATANRVALGIMMRLHNERRSFSPESKSSFLKKRSKKLLPAGIRGPRRIGCVCWKAKVFWFFFPKQNILS
jgi:hypothetical protein